jgi:hypothetical protein
MTKLANGTVPSVPQHASTIWGFGPSLFPIRPPLAPNQWEMPT